MAESTLCGVRVKFPTNLALNPVFVLEPKHFSGHRARLYAAHQ